MKTIYVIGAGASYEANLPLGVELKETIANKLRLVRPHPYKYYVKSAEIHEAIKSKANHDEKEILRYKDQCKAISDAMPISISIDNYVDAHRDNTKLQCCAKLAIVDSILEAERRSLLMPGKSPNALFTEFSKLADTWYVRFFQTLTENCSIKGIQSRLENVTLIIFNYDRCVEYFLITSLMTYYQIGLEKARELVLSIKIIHPYGMVGKLKSLYPNGGTDFGQEPGVDELLKLSESIKTFTEGMASEDSEANIEAEMKEASRIVFLGFAFHPLNMKLLFTKMKGGDVGWNFPKVYATAYGVSEEDQSIIQTMISKLYRPATAHSGHLAKHNVSSLKCKDFFAAYSLSLGYGDN